MSHTVVLDLPDPLFRAVEDAARVRGVTVEDALRDSIHRVFAPDEWEWGEPTEEEQVQPGLIALEREDLWGSEADGHWDTWTPSSPAT